MTHKLRYLSGIAFILFAFMSVLLDAQLFTPIPEPKAQFFDSNGDPLNGGKLYTCTAGGACPGTTQATYSDYLGTTTNANPVILDSAGRAAIFYSSALNYKFLLRDSSDNTIYTIDGVRFAAVDQIIGTGSQVTASGATGTVTLSLAGPHNFTSQNQDGVVYGNASGALAATTQGGANSILAANASTPFFTTTPQIQTLRLVSIAFASLTSHIPSSNSTIIYCSDCTKATPCASGGSGALAKRLNNAWDCD